MERKQFTFYSSYYKAIKKLRPADQTKVLLAICEYALNGNETELNDVCGAVFELIQPTLDASAKKSANGKMRGTGKQSESKTEANESKREANRKQTEANEKQNESKWEQTVNEGENENENENEIEYEKENEYEYEEEVEVENECYAREVASTTGEAKRVISAFQKKLGSLLSDTAVRELINTFVPALGYEVCVYGLDAALNAGRREWNYIRAILNRYQSEGYKSVAQITDAEAEREKRPTKLRRTPEQEKANTAAMKESFAGLEGALSRL